MASFNRVIIAGNCTRDADLKYLQSGTAVCDLGIAVNERVKKGEEWVDEPTFVDVTLFARQAEVAGEYLKKGSSVLIEGRLKFEQWEKDGQKRSKLKVIGERMQMLGGRSGGDRDQDEDQSERPQRQERHAPPPQDDIPF